MIELSKRIPDEIQFDEQGLVPVIAQEIDTGDVLMLAYMNRDALEKTLTTGEMHYYSRSRQCLWHKGETSGHFQKLHKLYYDCDGDTLLAQVRQTGAACHTGHSSCFYRSIETEQTDLPVAARSNSLENLYDVIAERQANPKEGSYTTQLLRGGIDRILKKVGEESAEVIIASKNRNKDEIIYETADLLYHLSVALVHTGVMWSDVFGALDARKGKTKSEYQDLQQ